MTLLTINTAYKAESANSVNNAGQDPTRTKRARVDEIAKSALSSSETVSPAPLSETKNVELVSNDKKSGAMWEYVGNDKGIECFKLKAEFNLNLNPDYRGAVEETIAEIFPAVEPFVDFSGPWPLNDLRCLRFGKDEKFVKLLNELGFRCEVKDDEFYLYIPDMTTLQSGWEKYRAAHPDLNLPPLNIILSKGIASERAFIDAFYTHDGLMSTDAELLHDQLHLFELLDLMWRTKGNYAATRECVRNVIKLGADLPLQSAVASDKALPYQRELEIMISIFIDSISHKAIFELAEQKGLPKPHISVILPTASQCLILTNNIRTLLCDRRWCGYLKKRHASQDVAYLSEAWHTMQMKFFLAQANVTIAQDDLKPLLGSGEEFVKVLALLAEHNFLNQNSWNLLIKEYPYTIDKQTRMLTDAAKYGYKSLNTQEKRDQALELLTKHQMVSEDALKIFEGSRAPLQCAAVLIALAQNSVVSEVENDLFFKLELERVLSSEAAQNFKQNISPDKRVWEIIRKSGDPVAMRAQLSMLAQHNLLDCTFAVLEQSDRPLSLAQALVWIVEELTTAREQTKHPLPDAVKREFRKISTLPELGGYRTQINEIVERVYRERAGEIRLGSDSPAESFWKYLISL